MTKLKRLQHNNATLLVDENNLIYDTNLEDGNLLELMQINSINLLTDLLYQIEEGKDIKLVLLDLIQKQQNTKKVILQQILGISELEIQEIINRYPNQNLKEIIQILIKNDPDNQISYDNYFYQNLY